MDKPTGVVLVEASVTHNAQLGVHVTAAMVTNVPAERPHGSQTAWAAVGGYRLREGCRQKREKK